MAKRYCVVYWIGGTDNFTWHRSVPFADADEARTVRGDVARQGYPAMVKDYDRSVAIGLPETFEAADTVKS